MKEAGAGQADAGSESRLVRTHLDNVERQLLAEAARAGILESPVNKGTAREIFVRTFLEDHLGSHLAVGQGEIVDAASRRGDRRPQMDAVVYERKFPKLRVARDLDAFFVESVLATIEVKSTLNRAELERGMRAAQRVKALSPSKVQGARNGGYKAPSVLCYLVAYAGPSAIQTVYAWLRQIQNDMGIAEPSLPPSMKQRTSTPSSTLDGIYVLGSGTIQFDNAPVGVCPDEIRQKLPHVNWYGHGESTGNLYLLFLNLVVAGSSFDTSRLNPEPYVQSDNIIPAIAFGAGLPPEEEGPT